MFIAPLFTSDLAHRLARSVTTLFAAAVLAGCAVQVQQPVDLAPDYLRTASTKNNRIGVVMADLPKADTAFPGAFCLLCLGVANLAHTQMNKEVQSFSTDELKPLPAELVALLQKQGFDAVLITDPLKVSELPDLGAADPVNKSRKNFGTLKTKHKLDRLLVVDFAALGVWRSYSAYVPSDVPKAVAKGGAFIVDLSTHTLEWFMPLDLSRAADGVWDEPPKFPGLSNAYYQVLETAKDRIKAPFKPATP
jgi:hypothetical protein